MIDKFTRHQFILKNFFEKIKKIYTSKLGKENKTAMKNNLK